VLRYADGAYYLYCRRENIMLDWIGESAEIYYGHLHQYRFAKEFVKNKNVLDLASGEGYGSFMLSEEADSVAGLDTDEISVRHASTKYLKENLRFIEGSITDIPVDGQKIFDVIVCFKVPEHLEERHKLLREVKRLLKTDGIFIVSIHNKYIDMDQPNDQTPVHQKELYFDEFKDLLSNNFQHAYLCGQKVCPSSSIFPLQKELGPPNDFFIEKADDEFHFLPSERKLAGYLIAVASDSRLDENLILGNSYLLDLSETLFPQRDAQISHLKKLVRRKEAALNQKDAQISRLERMLRDKKAALDQIYASYGWKALLIFYKWIEKILPMNIKRRLIAKGDFKAMTEPGRGVRNTEPAVLEKEIEKKIPKASPMREAMEVSDKQYEEVLESTRGTMSTGLDRVEDPGKKSDVSALMDDIRLIAFYLPQYHPIPENDRWWGRGFTDWNNVAKATPNFIGHYQPHLPADLGFYDLRMPEVREQQAEMAREYGIDGFCYHHYWFNGRRLLERPFNEVLKTGRPSFPFCLCWANENWTRRWDGAEHEILIAQAHSKEDDIAFIRDIIPAFRDDRYIRVNGKPLLIVYRVSLLPNPQATADIWRAECRGLGVGDIYLCAAQSFGITDPRPYGFDAAVEFPPHGLGFFIPEISEDIEMTNPDFTGNIFGYEDVVQFEKKKKRPHYTLFRTVMPSWDNTPRKQNASIIFAHVTPDLYKEWLAHVIEYSNKNLYGDERLVFINAWNEWAEGAHLEPDRKYGDKFLTATKSVLEKLCGT
jgi:SAM-dependent methyltransferase